MNQAEWQKNLAELKRNWLIFLDWWGKNHIAISVFFWIIWLLIALICIISTLKTRKENPKVPWAPIIFMELLIIFKEFAVKKGWFESVLLIVLFVGLLSAGIILTCYWILAPNNRFFTFVKEGTAKIVVKGDKFARCLMQREGKTFAPKAKGENASWNIIDGKGAGTLFGLRWVGIWPFRNIYTYKFQWTGVDEDGSIARHPNEVLDYILLKSDMFYATVENAEDKDGLNLKVEILLTIRVVNPYKALFAIQNWLESVINTIEAVTRTVMTGGAYKEINASKEKAAQDIEAGAVQAIHDMELNWGVLVEKIQIKNIDPPDVYRQTILAPLTAELEKTSAITKAEAEARSTVLKADAEAERIKRKLSAIKEFGDLGQLVAMLEAMEKSTLAASVVVQSIPGIQEALRRILDNRGGEKGRIGFPE